MAESNNPAPPASAATATAAPVAPPVPELPPGVRLYECMWLVDANVGREDVSKVMAGLREIVEKGGGTWINADKWEERRLAYTIKKKKRGLYIINHFSAPTDAVVKIERNARLSDLVLRHMILVDEDGLTMVPTVRTAEEEDFGGFGGSGFGGGGGERRYFGSESR